MVTKKKSVSFLDNKKELSKKPVVKKEISKKIEVTIPILSEEKIKEYTGIVPTIKEIEYVKYYPNYFAIKKMINNIRIIQSIKKEKIFSRLRIFRMINYIKNKFNEVTLNG